MVIEVVELGLSDWCETHRIEVRLGDGSIQRFFTKVRPESSAFIYLCLLSYHLISWQTASGHDGFEQVRAHWYSESSLYKFIPEYIPRPIAFDTYKSSPNTHFLLMDFVDMIDERHTRSGSLHGRTY